MADWKICSANRKIIRQKLLDCRTVHVFYANSCMYIWICYTYAIHDFTMNGISGTATNITNHSGRCQALLEAWDRILDGSWMVETLFDLFGEPHLLWFHSFNGFKNIKGVLSFGIIIIIIIVIILIIIIIVIILIIIIIIIIIVKILIILILTITIIMMILTGIICSDNDHYHYHRHHHNHNNNNTNNSWIHMGNVKSPCSQGQTNALNSWVSGPESPAQSDGQQTLWPVIPILNGGLVHSSMGV